jgi:hypothetical protein
MDIEATATGRVGRIFVLCCWRHGVFSLGARPSKFAHLFSQQSATWFDCLIAGWIITTRVITTRH